MADRPTEIAYGGIDNSEDDAVEERAQSFHEESPQAVAVRLAGLVCFTSRK